MADAFSQIHIHLVLVVQGRSNLILPHWEDELHKYIAGIIQRQGQKLLIINGVADHIHILIDMKPSCRLSDLVREIKKSSNEFINTRGFIKTRFAWQAGYGAFSYSHSALDTVIRYIKNQKEHHKKVSAEDEFKTILKKFEVDFKEEYLFNWIAK